MSKTIKTEAIVLKRKNLLDKDTLITFFSKESGKVNVFAKGIKTISSKRLPHTQTANLIKAVIYNKDGKMFLQETSLLSGFSDIKRDSKKISFLYFFFHVLDRLLPENQREDRVYDETKRFLINLSRKDATIKLLEKHLNKLLQDLGYIHGKKSLEQLHRIVEELTNEKIPLLII